ncbi:MAG: sulfite exporter TauE/SafE family protein [Candidatus Omnitrophota bacterium]
MKENLYYLLTAGLILGSGPCLWLCAPVLISYIASNKQNTKKSLISYLTFSAFKLLGYTIMGILAAVGVKLLNIPFLARYLDSIFLLLGVFIILIGISTIFYREKGLGKICGWVNKGNVKNVGILGLLIGLAPCAPLLGILNYIVIISRIPYEAIIFSLVFGIGTVLSPLLILVILSAKLANFFSQNKKIKLLIRIICGLILIVLGARILIGYISI